MSRILSARARGANGLNVALEGLVDGDEPVEIIDAPVTTELEEHREELAEASDDVEAAHEVIEELEEGATGLEGIALSLESSLASGGIGPEAAVFLQHAITAHTKRLGITRSLVPSMESFGGESTKQQATNISMESVKETLNKVWEAIKKAFWSVVAAVKAFFDRLFNIGPRIKHAAEGLKKKVEEAKHENGGEIELGGLAGKISFGGKVGGIVEGITNTATAFKHIAQNIEKAYDGEHLTSVKSKFTKEELKDEAGKKAIVGQLVTMGKEQAKGIEGINTGHTSSDSKVEFKSAEMSGGNTFVLTYELAKEGDSLSSATSKVVPGPSLRLEHTGGAAGKGEKVHALSKADAIKVLDQVIEIADLCIKAKGDSAKAVQQSEVELNYAKGMASLEEGADAGAVSAMMRAIGKRASNGIRSQYVVYKFAAEAVHPYLVVVEKSFKAHAKAGEGKKDEGNKEGGEGKGDEGKAAA
jgi:hypothetical protein